MRLLMPEPPARRALAVRSLKVNRLGLKKKLIGIVIVLVAFTGFTVAPDQRVGAQKNTPVVGPQALWQPGMQIMQSIRQECGSAPNFGECFVSQMRKSGASPQAVAFTKLTGNTGYLRDFHEMGRIDVAYVNYPFRANENQGCLLVNGTPHVLDVDDTSAIPNDDLLKNARYAELARKYPNITIFPGDRNGTDYPATKKLPGGSQRFVVKYRLLNGCHACERIGDLSLAFDFDRTGKFLGRKFVAVEETPAMAAQPNESGAAGGEQADPTKPIRGKVGQEFTLRLASNRTTGYQWQLAESPDESIVRLVGTEYVRSETKLAGAGGEEAWTFKAVGKGKASILMKYVRPWEKNAVPAKSLVFAVHVE